MRNLASIQQISRIDPIEGADSIEVAQVLGWQCVVKKGEFQEGDHGVYIEIDSVLPDKPAFEFLRPRGYRVRTIKLRKQISQGLFMPLSILGEMSKFTDGADVTEFLGITKYEPPIPAQLAGKMKGSFPSFIPKTDETRVQNLQRLLDKYEGYDCYVAEKLDGSSVTFYLKDGEFGVCSRNIDLIETPDNAFWRAARDLDIENKMRSISGTSYDWAIQGELVGEGIQGNKLNLKGNTVYFFNMFSISESEYLDFEHFKFAISEMGLQTVPILKEDFILETSIPDMVEFATRKSVINPNVWAEGVVIRLRCEKLDLMLSSQNFNNGRVSFKVINPEWLLKHAE